MRGHERSEWYECSEWCECSWSKQLGGWGHCKPPQWGPGAKPRKFLNFAFSKPCRMPSGASFFRSPPRSDHVENPTKLVAARRTSLAELVKTCQNSSKLVKTRQNSSKASKLVETRRTLSRLRGKIFHILLKIIKFHSGTYLSQK